MLLFDWALTWKQQDGTAGKPRFTVCDSIDVLQLLTLFADLFLFLRGLRQDVIMTKESHRMMKLTERGHTTSKTS